MPCRITGSQNFTATARGMNWKNVPWDSGDCVEAEKMRQTRGRSGKKRHRDGPSLKKGASKREGNRIDMQSIKFIFPPVTCHDTFGDVRPLEC